MPNSSSSVPRHHDHRWIHNSHILSSEHVATRSKARRTRMAVPILFGILSADVLEKSLVENRVMLRVIRITAQQKTLHY